MQKIQNLKYYTSTEIGLVRDAEEAEQRYAHILQELAAAIGKLPGVKMAEDE